MTYVFCSLEGVRTSLDGLRAQSTDVFAFVAQAKSSLPDIQELRNTIQESMKGEKSVFDLTSH